MYTHIYVRMVICMCIGRNFDFRIPPGSIQLAVQRRMEMEA